LQTTDSLHLFFYTHRLLQPDLFVWETKDIWGNLHMASLSAVKMDADLKHYYERKVAEGKRKLSVLNAVKNKLLARVAAVVNKQELYVKKAA
jgi:hypothetical protein